MKMEAREMRAAQVEAGQEGVREKESDRQLERDWREGMEDRKVKG